MTRKKRRTEITVETERIVVVRKRGASVLAHCEKCGKTVAMIPLEDVAILSGATLVTVCRKLRAGEVHSKRMAGGSPMVCLESLFLT